MTSNMIEFLFAFVMPWPDERSLAGIYTAMHQGPMKRLRHWSDGFCTDRNLKTFRSYVSPQPHGFAVDESLIVGYAIPDALLRLPRKLSASMTIGSPYVLSMR